MGPKALDISSQDNLPIKHGNIVGIENYRETFEGNRMVVYIYIHRFVPIPPRETMGICLNQTGSDNLMSLRQSVYNCIYLHICID